MPQGPTQCQSRQEELIRVLIYLVYLLIHNPTGLCTTFPHLYVTLCDVTYDVTYVLVTPYVTLCDIFPML